MSALDTAFAFTMSFEGGLSVDSRDPGGTTKYGISARAYPDLDIPNLTLEDARIIYEQDYWRPVGADGLPPPLALAAADAAFNHGVRRAQEWLEASGGDYVTFCLLRMSYFVSLKTLYPVYGRGWQRRAVAVLDAAHRLAKESHA